MHKPLSSFSRDDFYGSKYLRRLRNEIERAEKKITKDQPQADTNGFFAGDVALSASAFFDRSIIAPEIKANLPGMPLFPSISNKEKAVPRPSALQRQKSTIVHREPVAHEKAPTTSQRFEEIELPLLSVTKKPVNAYTKETNPRSPLPDRRQEYSVQLQRARTKYSPAPFEGSRSRILGSPRDRLVISPSLSLYSDRSFGSAASIEDLALLTVRGERLTPVSATNLSPAQSPNRTPHEMQSPNASVNGERRHSEASVRSDASRQTRLPSNTPAAGARRLGSMRNAAPPALAQRFLHSPRSVSRRDVGRDSKNTTRRDLGLQRSSNTSRAADTTIIPGVYYDFGYTVQPPADQRKEPARRPVRKRDLWHPRTAVGKIAAGDTATGLGDTLRRQTTVVAEAGTQTDTENGVAHAEGEPRAAGRAPQQVPVAQSGGSVQLYSQLQGPGGKSKKASPLLKDANGFAFGKTSIDAATKIVSAREGAPKLPSIQLVEGKAGKRPKKATIVVKSVFNETKNPTVTKDEDSVVHYSRESTIHIDIAIHNADEDFEPSLDLATEALLLALPMQKTKSATTRSRSAAEQPPPPPSLPAEIPEIRMTSATPPGDSGSDA